MDENFINLHCPSCKTEIQASSDMSGQTTECPACGEKLTIPSQQKEIVRRGIDDLDPDTIRAMKSRTIRIELGDI